MDGLLSPPLVRAKVRLARDNPIFSVPAFVGMRGSAVQRRPSTIRRHDHYIPPPHAANGPCLGCNDRTHAPRKCTYATPSPLLDSSGKCWLVPGANEAIHPCPTPTYLPTCLPTPPRAYFSPRPAPSRGHGTGRVGSGQKNFKISGAKTGCPGSIWPVKSPIINERCCNRQW